MPIYEFVCSRCSRQFEELVLGSSEKISCPQCGSKKVKRAMSVFSFSSSGTFRSSAGSLSALSCKSCTKTSCAHCSGS